MRRRLASAESELNRRLDGKLSAAEARLRVELRGVGADAGRWADALAGAGERMTGRIDDLRDRLARISQSESRDRETLEHVSRLVDNDKDRLYESILHTAAQVNGKGGIGGGTVIYSRPDGDRGALTYILTAYHVIHRSLSSQDNKEVREPVGIRLFDEAGVSLAEHNAEILSYDDKQDIALLRVWLPRPTPHVAKLAAPEKVRGIRVFTPVYAVGCPLGHDPMPTLGQIASLHKEVNGAPFWMMNAPTIFGNSGGGIFLTDSLELVGISSMICTYDQFISMPVPHLGILVSMDNVYGWLDRQYLQYVYDPASAKDLCDRRRKEAREKDPEVTRVTWD